MRGLIEFISALSDLAQGVTPLKTRVDEKAKLQWKALFRASGALVMAVDDDGDGDNLARLSDVEAVLNESECKVLSCFQVKKLARKFSIHAENIDASTSDDVDSNGDGTKPIVMMARVLLLCSVRSRIKERAISHIMSLPTQLQQELMLDIRDTEETLLKSSKSSKSPNGGVDAASTSNSRPHIDPHHQSSQSQLEPGLDVSIYKSQIERFRRQLHLAEEEARSCGLAVKQSQAEAEVERTKHECELSRLKSELQNCKDELDVAQDQAKQVGLMQKKIQKYEARMDEAATVAAQLVQSKTLVQSLQEKIDNNDNEIRLQALQERFDQQKDVLANCEAALHGARAEKKLLSQEVQRLSRELENVQAETRLLQQKVDASVAETTSSTVNSISLGAELHDAQVKHTMTQTIPDPNIAALESTRVELLEARKQQNQTLKDMEELQLRCSSFESRSVQLSMQVSASEARVSDLSEQLSVEEANLKCVSDERDSALTRLRVLTEEHEKLSELRSQKDASVSAEDKENTTASGVPPDSHKVSYPLVEDLREELALVSSAFHGMALEFQRRRLKQNGANVPLSSSNTRLSSTMTAPRSDRRL